MQRMFDPAENPLLAGGQAHHIARAAAADHPITPAEKGRR